MPHHVFRVAAAESGLTVAAVVRARLELSWGAVRQLVREGRLWIQGAVCLDPDRRIKGGQRLEVRPASPSGQRPRSAQQLGPAPRPTPQVLYADAHVVVVDKPAGLTTMRHAQEAEEFGSRARRYLPRTLADLLPGLLGASRASVRAVHRLDKETSGLVVFARTVEAERDLGRQFRSHTTERRYLALVRGRAQPGRIESYLVRDRGDGRRGSTKESGTGQRAVTQVEVLEALGAYTLVQCRLETGRTHQVRIHLGEQGTPLCGERLYDRPLHGKPLPDDSGAPRVALHATRLGFRHPATGKWREWEAPLPDDLGKLLARLRRAYRQASGDGRPPGSE